MYKNIEGMTREDRRAAVRTIEARRAALVECYKQTREGEPADTIAELIARIGYADALAAVAELVNNVDEWDARIWEYVREWAQGIETAATSAELETFGIYQPSSIHPAHINQLGQAMRNTPAPSTTTTTTIYFKPEDIGRGLNWDDIHAADALGVGMLEQVLPDLIAFHSLQASEVPAVLEWLAEYFGLEWVDVSECETCGNFEKEISNERVYIGKGDPTKCGSCPAADAAPIEEAEKEVTEEAAEEVAQMTDDYRIENTTAPNGRASVEVYFNSIPAKATREALKAAGFRWHSVKKCWYGYTDSENARAIIDGSADNWGDIAGATTAPSGYKWQSNAKHEQRTPENGKEEKQMLKINSKKASENIKKYILDDLYYLEDRNDWRKENGGRVFDLGTFPGVAACILDIFSEEKGGEKYPRYCSEYARFKDWAQGLALGNLFCYYYNRSAIEDAAAILEESPAEAARYTEEQAAELITRMIYNAIKKAAMQ